MNALYFIAFVCFLLILYIVKKRMSDKVSWKIVTSKRVGDSTQVQYDIYDGDRYVERVICTKEDSGECFIEGTKNDDVLSRHFNQLPKDAHITWSEAMLELYLKKFY